MTVKWKTKLKFPSVINLDESTDGDNWKRTRVSDNWTLSVIIFVSFTVTINIIVTPDSTVTVFVTATVTVKATVTITVTEWFSC